MCEAVVSRALGTNSSLFLKKHQSRVIIFQKKASKQETAVLVDPTQYKWYIRIPFCAPDNCRSRCELQFWRSFCFLNKNHFWILYSTYLISSSTLCCSSIQVKKIVIFWSPDLTASNMCYVTWIQVCSTKNDNFISLVWLKTIWVH